MAHANAQYVGFLDADDMSLPHRLAESVDYLDQTPDVAMVFGAIQYWYSWDQTSATSDFIAVVGGLSDERVDPPEAALMLYPLGSGQSAAVTGLVRRSAFDAVGGFEERFRGLFEDQAFLLKIHLRYPIYVSSRTWHRYRQHDASCSSSATRADHVRRRGDFLQWAATYVGQDGDGRVVEAVSRARRRLHFQRLTSPAYEVFDRMPDGVQRRLRALRVRGPRNGG